jgi:hypothetical protein
MKTTYLLQRSALGDLHMLSKPHKLVFYRRRTGEIVLKNKSEGQIKELDMVYIAAAFLLRVFWLNLAESENVRVLVRNKILLWVKDRSIPNVEYSFPSNRKFILKGGPGYFVKVKLPLLLPEQITNAALDLSRYIYHNVDDNMKCLFIDLLSSYTDDIDQQPANIFGLSMIKKRLDNSLTYYLTQLSHRLNGDEP